MNETKFLVKYSIKEEHEKNFLKLIRELKSLINAEGLVDYSVFVDSKNKLAYTEVYTFESKEAYDNYDDEADERVNILMSKMSEFVAEKTTKYSVINKVDLATGDE